ncbi:hypothetical protein GCM10027614_49990 [Micromonospora vulcania]
MPLLLAGLGAVAGVASLVGEWLVMTVPDGGPGPDSSIEVPAGLSEVGGFGVGYLVGLLGLVCIVALALRGTAAIRPNARLAGLTLTGALLALLIAAATTLDDPAQRSLLYTAQEGFRAEYGRGLVMAFVACLLLGAALRLPAAALDGGPAGPAADDDLAGGAGRGWRRRQEPIEEDGRSEPADLTVTSAVPFAHPEPPR